MVFDEMLMQFQADILGVSVIRPKVAETTALGAAYAAGLATGVWTSLADLRQNWHVGRTWEPGMEPARRAELYREWKRAVTRTFGWIEDPAGTPH
jgi:glycerol kinase